jgi:hypothetical protein
MLHPSVSTYCTAPRDFFSKVWNSPRPTALINQTRIQCVTKQPAGPIPAETEDFMTFRNLALVTALTSVTALAAQAQDQGMSGDYSGSTVVTDPFEEMGVEYEMEGMSAVNVDVPDIDDAGVSEDIADDPDATRAADSEAENILAVAGEGAEVWTSDNMPIGRAFRTADYDEGNHLVYVEVADEANLPVEVVAFPIQALRVANEGVRLEHSARMDDLRAEIDDRVQG